MLTESDFDSVKGQKSAHPSLIKQWFYWYFKIIMNNLVVFTVIMLNIVWYNTKCRTGNASSP